MALAVCRVVEICEIAGACWAGVVRTGPLFAGHRGHGFDHFVLGGEFGEFRFPVGKLEQWGGQGGAFKPVLKSNREGFGGRGSTEVACFG